MKAGEKYGSTLKFTAPLINKYELNKTRNLFHKIIIGLCELSWDILKSKYFNKNLYVCNIHIYKMCIYAYSVDMCMRAYTLLFCFVFIFFILLVMDYS